MTFKSRRAARAQQSQGGASWPHFGTYTDSTSVDETPPAVSFTGPDSVTAGQTATFTTSFDDPNGNTATAWSVYWGDGDEDETTYGDPSSLTHVYTKSPNGGGDWTVMAMASDVDGNFWADDATIAVVDATPIVALSSTITPTAGSVYDLDTTFTDPEGRTPYNWIVNWGDGADGYHNGGGAPEHVYLLPGSYDVAATAIVAPTDRDSQTNESYSATLSVSVADAATFSFEVDAGAQGSHSQAEVDFIDPDGVTPTLYTVYWGDGSGSYDADYGNVFGHTYTAAGSLTATAVASTVEGDFTATQTVDVSPADPGLIINAPFWGDGSQPYPVAVYFSPDIAGNPTSQFPVADAGVGFTVNWGDGSTGSYSDNHFSHIYTYLDPNTYSNGYGITVVASGDDGLYTATAGAAVGVQQPDGGGAITLGDSPSGVTEGNAFTFGAGFSDPEQTDASGIGGRWAVWWGDGSSQGDLGGLDTETDYSPTHTYVEPGNYQVTFAVEYNEVHDPGGEPGYIAISDPASIAVAEATPTLSASSTAGTLTVGDEYVLNPTYTDTVGDHVPDVMTIDWGDGSASTFEGANQPQTPVTHLYTTAGSFDPTLSLSAFLNDGHITATAAAVGVVAPTAGITALSDVATESGQAAASFEITRTGNDFDLPLTVSYSLGGTLDSDAYLVTDDNGRILDGGATIPAGSSAAEVFVYPLEDQTPRWTETVDLTLTASDNYAVDGTASAAGVYVVNDDVYAWLDNGSDNDIFEGGLPADGGTLVPLVLDLPDEVRNGAEITLVDNAPTEADVYTTSDPGDSDTPILGDVSGTPVSEVTWTQGSDDTAPHGETTLWVEGINGSASINDISFEIYDSDAGCGADGTASDPTLPQYDGDEVTPTYATTTASGPVNGAADLVPHIIEEDSNTTKGVGGDVEGVTQNWLVGQIVNLKATISGPPQLNLGKFTANWIVAGNVLANYVDDSQHGVKTELAGKNTVVSGTHYRVTGTGQPNVQFFWVANDNGQANQTDRVQVVIAAPAVGVDFLASTTFNVEEPSSTFDVTEQGTTTLHNPGPGVNQAGAELGDRLANPPVSGIEIAGSVTMQGDFVNQVGTWKDIQLITINRTGSAEFGGVLYKNLHTQFNGQTLLDAGDPYPVFAVPGGTDRLPNPVFTTGQSETMGDNPAMFFGNIPVVLPAPIGEQRVDLSTADLSEAYQDFQMFRPPGESCWVPLHYQDWSWSVGASLNGLLYVYSHPPNGPSPGDPAPGSYEPEWGDVAEYGSQKDYELYA